MFGLPLGYLSILSNMVLDCIAHWTFNPDIIVTIKTGAVKK